jgi:cell division protein FtsN
MKTSQFKTFRTGALVSVSIVGLISGCDGGDRSVAGLISSQAPQPMVVVVAPPSGESPVEVAHRISAFEATRAVASAESEAAEALAIQENTKIEERTPIAPMKIEVAQKKKDIKPALKLPPHAKTVAANTAVEKSSPKVLEPVLTKEQVQASAPPKAEKIAEAKIEKAVEAKVEANVEAKSEKVKGVKPVSAEFKSASDTQEKIYIVQVGLFKVKENADKLFAKMKANGFPVLIREKSAGAGIVYAIRLEPTPSKKEADEMVLKIKEKTGIAAAVSVKK